MTESGWESSADLGPGDLALAARAARTIGKTGRTRMDRAVAVALAVLLFGTACGAVPLLIPAYFCWLSAVRRSRRLDRRPWTAATPTRGARRFRASPVSGPEGLDPSYRRYRWWSVVDDAGRPVFGLVGAKPGTTERCILPFSSSVAAVDPMEVPGFWQSNATVYSSTHEKGYTILHLCRSTGEPVLAVRFGDPAGRREIEVLVYSSDALGDPGVAILSCLALFVKKARSRRPRSSQLDPAPATADGCSDRPPPAGEGRSRPSEPVHDAWPRGFLGTEAVR